MKRFFFLIILILMLSILLPGAQAVVEEDWEKYTRIEESQRDKSGKNVTLSWLRSSYSNENGNYTVKLKDFDAAGMAVIDLIYQGRSETIFLSGEWNADRTKVILLEPVEAFNKTLLITPVRIVPPAGIFVCCPELEVNIKINRPELYIDFVDESSNVSKTIFFVNPFANWTYDPLSDPYDESREEETVEIDEISDSYRIKEEIPIELSITNYGGAESQDTVVIIDADGLIFDRGYPFYQLPTLGGKEQDNFIGRTNQTIKLKLKFPSPPDKLNYMVHAYVKGKKEGTTYYYDAHKEITLLPSVDIRKSVTEESILISRENVDEIYPALDPDDIYRWLIGENIFVSVGVTNNQNYQINGINLSDTLHSLFSTDTEVLNWKFDLKPYETKEFKYRLEAERSGKFILPPALLTYSEQNLSWRLLSNTPSTEVHGPCIQVFKKPGKPIIFPGENATIEIIIKNIGDMPSGVRINDSLPENSTFLEGIMDFEGILRPRETATISYNISIDTLGQIQLPGPIIYINERPGMECGEPILSKLVIKEPPEATPVETVIIPEEIDVQLPETVSYRYNWIEGVLPALLIILAVTVLLMLNRSQE